MSTSSVLPAITRHSLRRELVAWSLFAVAMGALEGAVTGVLIKTVFVAAVSRGPLNFAVALASGAGMFANLSGLFWTALGNGRSKVLFIVVLQLSLGGILLALALVPVHPVGLGFFVLGVALGRILWTGALAVRSSIWRANYPRDTRARITARFLTAHALLVALTALGMGTLLEQEPDSFRWLYPITALAALGGVLCYRRLRVQCHRTLLNAEARLHPNRLRLLSVFWKIARTDRAYAGYLLCMTLFGGGNIMLIAPLIASLNDHLTLGQRDQMLILVVLPMVIVPLALPFWARLLDRKHIIDYRVVHCWSFLFASTAWCVGAIAEQTTWFWTGAVLWGVATAGGELGWNLGHNDFASGANAAHYMGLHMTLTGLRGLAAPILGISAYETVERLCPGAGAWALLLPLSFTLAGTIGFALLARAGLHAAKAPALPKIASQ